MEILTGQLHRRSSVNSISTDTSFNESLLDDGLSAVTTPRRQSPIPFNTHPDLPPSYDESQAEHADRLEDEARLTGSPDHHYVQVYRAQIPSGPIYPYIPGPDSNRGIETLGTSNDTHNGIPGKPRLSVLLNQALVFTSTAPPPPSVPDFTSHLTRPVAIPALGSPTNPIQFARLYARNLQGLSITAAQFASFIEGLNAISTASSFSVEKLEAPFRFSLDRSDDYDGHIPREEWMPAFVHLSNVHFFAPRGLRVQITTLKELAELAKVPLDLGFRAKLCQSVLRASGAAAGEGHDLAMEAAQEAARILDPYIEPLTFMIPEMSTDSATLNSVASQLAELTVDTKVPLQESNESNMDQRDSTIDGSPGDQIHYSSSPASFIPLPRGPAPMMPHLHGPLPMIPPPHLHGPLPMMPLPHPHGPMPMMPPPHGPLPTMPIPKGPLLGMPLSFGPMPPMPPPFDRRSTGSDSSDQTPPQPTQQMSWQQWGEDIGRRWDIWGAEYERRWSDWGDDQNRRWNMWGKNFSDRISSSASASSVSLGSGASLHGSVGAPTTAATRSAEPDANAQQQPQPQPQQPTPPQPTAGEERDWDDGASISSDSSIDSSGSETEVEENNPEAVYAAKVATIEAMAEEARSKGKTPRHIARDREKALQKAENEKKHQQVRIQKKNQKRSFKLQAKEWKREVKALKKELKNGWRDMKNLSGPERAAKKAEMQAMLGERRKQWEANAREWRECHFDLDRQDSGSSSGHGDGSHDGHRRRHSHHGRGRGHGPGHAHGRGNGDELEHERGWGRGRGFGRSRGHGFGRGGSSSSRDNPCLFNRRRQNDENDIDAQSMLWVVIRDLE